MDQLTLLVIVIGVFGWLLLSKLKDIHKELRDHHRRILADLYAGTMPLLTAIHAITLDMEKELKELKNITKQSQRLTNT